MTLDRRRFADHHDRFVRIVAEIHQLTAGITLLSFVGYAVAGVLWYRDHLAAALLTATGSYLLFRAFRPISLYLARWRLSSREGYPETLALLEEELRDHEARKVLADLEGMIEAAERGPGRRRTGGG